MYSSVIFAKLVQAKILPPCCWGRRSEVSAPPLPLSDTRAFRGPCTGTRCACSHRFSLFSTVSREVGLQSTEILFQLRRALARTGSVVKDTCALQLNLSGTVLKRENLCKPTCKNYSLFCHCSKSKESTNK